MESQTHKITYLDSEVEITQFLSESDEYFSKRMEFIRKLETDKIQWKDALKYSKIYYNCTFKNSKYTPMVYNMIKKYL